MQNLDQLKIDLKHARLAAAEAQNSSDREYAEAVARRLERLIAQVR